MHSAEHPHDPRTAADLGEPGAPKTTEAADTKMAIETVAPEPTAPPPEEPEEEEGPSSAPESFFGGDLPTGTRWRWYHLAPGFAPLAVLLILLIAGVPQQVLGRLHGADPMEPNDTIATATPIEPGTYADLTCRHGDVDWYRITIPSGKALKLEAKPGPEGNGALSIHTLKGETLAESVVFCTWMPPGLQETEVVARVWGGRMGRYAFKASLIDPRTRFEPNDLRRESTPVKPGVLTAIRADGRDWFVVEVPRWRGLTAKVTGGEGLGVHLLDGQRDTANGLSGTLPPEASLDATSLPRRVYVEVVGRGDYTLALSLGPPDKALMENAGEAPLPVSRDRLEPNQSPDTASTLKPAHYTNLQVNGADHYRVRVPANTTLQVDIRANQRWSNLNLATHSIGPTGRGLGLRQTRTAGGTHLLAFQDKAATVTFSLRGSASYAMKVRLRAGPPGTLVPPGEYPNLQGQGDDLWRIDLLPGQTVLTEVMTRRNDDEFGSTLSMEILGQGRARASSKRPVRANRRNRNRRRGRRIIRRKQRRLSTAIHGVGSLRYIAQQKESVLLRVTGTPQAYDLTVKLEGVGKVFRPTRAQTVVAGTFPRRVLQADSEAFYRLALKRDQVLVTSVTFNNAEADLDLELLDQTGMRLTQSASSESDEERIRFIPDRDQVAFLRVASTGLKSTRYDLVVSRDGSTRPSSVPLPLGKRRGIQCSGSDHYRIQLPAGQRLRVLATFKNADGDLDLSFLDSSGTELASSATRKDTETLTRTAAGAEEILIRVDGAKNAYDLTAIVDQPE